MRYLIDGITLRVYVKQALLFLGLFSASPLLVTISAQSSDSLPESFFHAHQQPLLRGENYLRKMGKWDDFKKLQKLVRHNDSPFVVSSSAARVRDLQVTLYLQYLAVSKGFSEVVRLREKGVDLVAAALHRPGFKDVDNFVDKADVLVVGRPVSLKSPDDRGDGYATTVSFIIEEVLKGEVDSDTIFIRQKSGLLSDGSAFVGPGELVTFRNISSTPSFTYQGDRELLIVSSDQYGLRVSQSGKAVLTDRIYFIQTEINFLVRGDSIIRSSLAPESVFLPSTLSAIRESVLRYEGRQ